MGGAKVRRALAGAGVMAAVCVLFGCLTRPIIDSSPTTKEYFHTVQRQGAVDKVDLLFMIDNSASMGDKQELLALAVPDLVSRLLEPKCVLETDAKVYVDRDLTTKKCPTGAKEEFDPIHDMHIGIVSSSLGGGGASDVCAATGHPDDRAHLLNRTKTGTIVPDAAPANFLAWMPDVPQNDKKSDPPVTRLKDKAQLQSDFQALVTGVGENGCGLEAQMESWYRFLVQPDPWDSIAVDRMTNSAQLQGVDGTILAQRKDFLRPDSLLAVIAVTDEEDSWSDPMWVGGKGWVTRANDNTFTKGGQLPRATSQCASNPNDPSCNWCGFANADKSDPSCIKGPYTPQEDGLNVRYTDEMQRRYGMNPQFPIRRYVDGLKSVTVPDRAGEHFTEAGEFRGLYVGRHNCVNPIYATHLPSDPNAELCKLERGPRTSDLVFFAVIGGVPWQLLTENPADPSARFKPSLDTGDWRRILGADPVSFDTSGIDPHMIESIAPRPDIACGTAGGNNTCDPIHGREWNTQTRPGLDLQYACTFPLKTPKDCSTSQTGCDCGAGVDSPLCDKTIPSKQLRGKAYPTIRELRVVKEMGDNGVVASLCPRELDNDKSDDFGYRPAVRAIVDRLKNVLGGQCLPQPLARNEADGRVSCLLLTILPGTQADQERACQGPGLKAADPAVLDRINAQRLTELQREAAATGKTATAADLSPICELAQIVPDGPMSPTYGGKPSCDGSGVPGWCYVEGTAAGTCTGGSSQAIKFGLPAPGPTIIQCIQNTK